MFENLFKKLKSFMGGANSEQKQTSQSCPACGAQMSGSIYDKTLHCSYCGSTSVNEEYLEQKNNAEQHPYGCDEEDEDDYQQDMTDAYMDHLNVVSNRDVDSVYAYIEKHGMFYSGEIPGLPFSKAGLCESYRECLDKLIASFVEEREKTFYEPPIQNLSEIQRKHPKAKIIKIS